jgi:rod shape-determining protein MreC
MVVTSYLQSDDSRELFLKRRRNFLRQLLNIIFAVALLVFDKRIQNNSIREHLSTASSTFIMVTHKPIDWFNYWVNLADSQQELVKDNQLLNSKILILEGRMHQLKVMNYQNKKLNQWLEQSDPTLKLALLGNIISLEVNHNRHLYILNKGKKNGVFKGQVAIDGDGVIGQIIDVGKYTSTLMLISDVKSAIPVINERTGEHGIVMGQNNFDTLELLNVPKTHLLTRGDKLLTSGLGLVYPFGIPVGVIKDVKNIPGEDFLKVTVVPAADINKNHMVMLLQSLKNIETWRHQLEKRRQNLEIEKGE